MSNSDAAIGSVLAHESWASATLSEIAGRCKRYAIAHTLAFFTFASATCESIWLGKYPSIKIILDFLSVALILLLIAAVIHMFLYLAVARTNHRQQSLISVLKQYFRAKLFSPVRVANVVHSCLFVTVFCTSCNTIRANISAVNPFSFDPYLSALDKAIHFGYFPHELLGFLEAFPYWIGLLNAAYTVWFVAVPAIWIWLAGRANDDDLLNRYMIAYALIWFIGSDILGTILSSAGPVYFDKVTGTDGPYQGLLAHLRTASASQFSPAVVVQAMIWDEYKTTGQAISGITAMPSLHVGQAVLFCCLFVTERKPIAAGLAIVFAILIFMGSVYLAWHYAVDGYVGAIIAMACWYISGKIANHGSTCRT